MLCQAPPHAPEAPSICLAQHSMPDLLITAGQISRRQRRAQGYSKVGGLSRSGFRPLQAAVLYHPPCGGSWWVGVRSLQRRTALCA